MPRSPLPSSTRCTMAPRDGFRLLLTTVFVLAMAPKAAAVPCGTPTTMDADNAVYTLTDCTTATSMSLGENVRNVTLRVLGGHVVPRVTVPFTVLQFQMVLNNVHAEVSHDLLWPRSGSIIDGLHITLDNATLDLGHGHSLLRVEEATMHGITLRMAQSVVTAAVQYLVRLTAADGVDVSNIFVDVSDSSIVQHADQQTVAPTGRSATATTMFYVRTSNSNRNHNISFRTRRSAMTLDVDCTDGSRCITAPAKDNQLRNALFRLVVAYAIEGIAFDMADSVATAIVAMPHPMGADSATIPNGTKLTEMIVFVVSFKNASVADVVVQVRNISAVMAANAAVALVALDGGDRLERVVLSIVNTDITQRSTGWVPLDVDDRHIAVVWCEADHVADVKLMLVDLRVQQYVTSGQPGEAVMKMALVSADLVFLSGNTTDISIDILRVALRSDVRNGTLPFLFITNHVMSALVTSTMVAAVRFEKGLNTERATVRLRDVQLLASTGFAVPEPSPVGQNVALCSSIVSLVSLQAHMSGCTVDVVNASTVVVATEFPLTSRQQRARRDPTDTDGYDLFVMANYTTVVDSFDPSAIVTPFANKTNPTTQYLLRTFLPPSVLKEVPVVLRNTTITLHNATPAMTTAHGLLHALESLDALAVVGVANELRSASIAVVVVASSGTWSGFTGPLSIFACVGGCLIQRSALAVRGDTPVAPSRSDAMVLSAPSTVFSFHFSPSEFGDGSTVVAAHLLLDGTTPTAAASTIRGGVFSASGHDATVVVRGTSLINVTQCRFRGDEANGGRLFSPSERYAFDDALPPVLLGCNLWNDRPLQEGSIGLPRNAVRYPPSTFNDSVVCPGFLSTATTTASHSMPPIATGGPPVSPSVVEQASQGVVGALSYATAAATVVLGGDVAALLDVQVLAAMGASRCGPPALKQATGLSRYMLSPFYDLGGAAMVVGNGGLAVLVTVVTLAAVWVSSRRDDSAAQKANHARSAEEGMSFLLRAHPSRGRDDDGPQEGATAGRGPVTPVATRWKYPHRPCLTAAMLVNGVVYGGCSAGARGDVIGVAVVVVAVLMVALGAAMYYTAYRSAFASRPPLRFKWYRRNLRQSCALPTAVPLGYWAPSFVKEQFGSLRNAVCAGKERFAIVPNVCTVSLTFLSGLPIPTALCPYQWALMSVFPLVGATVTLVCRPSRVPLSDGFQAVSLAVTTVLQLLCALLSTDVLDNNVLLSQSVMVLAMVSGALSVAKKVHGQYVGWWEGRIRASHKTEEGASLSEEPTALSIPEHPRHGADPSAQRRRWSVRSRTTTNTSFGNSSAEDVASQRHAATQRTQANLAALLELCMETAGINRRIDGEGPPRHAAAAARHGSPSSATRPSIDESVGGTRSNVSGGGGADVGHKGTPHSFGQTRRRDDGGASFSSSDVPESPFLQLL